VIKEVNPYLCAWLVPTYRARVIFLLMHPAAIAMSYLRLRGFSAQPEGLERHGHKFGAALHAA
jgi:hypothetical protein